MHDDPRPWRQLDSASVGPVNPYWSAHCDRVALPDESTHDYHYIRTPGSVLVVPVQHARDGASPRLLLARQYRYLMRTVVCEFPGGGIKAGTAPLEAAKAELVEETGYRAEHWQQLGWFNPCKGLVQERCHVYLALDLTAEANPPPGDHTEEISLTWRSVEEFDTAINQGEVHDGMTLAAWALARHHLVRA